MTAPSFVSDTIHSSSAAAIAYELLLSWLGEASLTNPRRNIAIHGHGNILYFIDYAIFLSYERQNNKMKNLLTTLEQAEFVSSLE